MTENEAILIMDGATRDEHLYMYDAEDRPYLIARAENIALNTLKEIQQYRAIGTVEDIEKSMQNVSVLLAEHEVLKSYQAIGTVEEFKALKEKNEPKKVDEEYCCPICHTCGMDDDGIEGDYCTSCGQALDWSE